MKIYQPVQNVTLVTIASGVKCDIGVSKVCCMLESPGTALRNSDAHAALVESECLGGGSKRPELSEIPR